MDSSSFVSCELKKDPIICPVCRKEYAKKNNLKRHIETVHEKLRPYPCEQCGEAFSERAILREHVGQVHEGLTFPCDICSATYGSRRNLLRHIRNTHNKAEDCEKPIFPCEFCDYKGNRKDNLKTHIANVHGLELKKPDYTENSNDANYFDGYSEDRNPIIPDLFVNEENIEYETNDFNQEKYRRIVHQCLYCDKSFPVHNKLQRHITSVHEREKPYKCDFCGVSMARKDNIKQHIALIHEKQKPHKCDLCEFSGPRKGDLNQHMFRVHGNQELNDSSTNLRWVLEFLTQGYQVNYILSYFVILSKA